MSERRIRRHTLGGYWVFDTLNCGEERYEWPSDDPEDGCHHRCSLPYDHEGNHKHNDFEWESNETLDTELMARRHDPRNVCDACRRRYEDWTADDDLWGRTVPEDGLLCFDCFIRRLRDDDERLIVAEYRDFGDGTWRSSEHSLRLEAEARVRAALTMAVELAKELQFWCDASLHEEQLTTLEAALETGGEG